MDEKRRRQKAEAQKRYAATPAGAAAIARAREKYEAKKRHANVERRIAAERLKVSGIEARIKELEAEARYWSRVSQGEVGS